VEVTESSIRVAVNDFLKRYSNDLGDISIKDVRTHVLNELSLPADYFRGERKETIFNIVKYFCASGGKREAEDEYKEGKFSKAESDLISRVGQDYANERGLTIEDLVSLLNVEQESSKKRYLDLWRHLRQLLPNRKHVSIWHHAQRLYSRPILGSGSFTEAEKKHLAQLVECHGRKYNIIGSLMNKLPDDCRQNLIRLQGRTVTGRFTKAEDARLVEAVRKVQNLQEGQDLPEKRLPWTAIAAVMKKERLPLDYSRRWPALVRDAKLGQGSGSGDSPQKGTSSGSSTLTKPDPGLVEHEQRYEKLTPSERKVQLLSRLQEGKYEDETEVVWADLDREFNCYQAASTVRWRSMQRWCENETDVVTFEERVHFLLDKYMGGTELGNTLSSTELEDGKDNGEREVQVESEAGGTSSPLASTKSGASEVSDKKKKKQEKREKEEGEKEEREKEEGEKEKREVEKRKEEKKKEEKRKEEKKERKKEKREKREKEKREEEKREEEMREEEERGAQKRKEEKKERKKERKEKREKQAAPPSSPPTSVGPSVETVSKKKDKEKKRKREEVDRCCDGSADMGGSVEESADAKKERKRKRKLEKALGVL